MKLRRGETGQLPPPIQNMDQSFQRRAGNDRADGRSYIVPLGEVRDAYFAGAQAACIELGKLSADWNCF